MVCYKVCLRVCGAGLNPPSVTAELGIQPTKVIRVGDPGPLGPAPIPVWMWQALKDDGSEKWNELEAGLQTVIDAFRSRKATLAELKQHWEVLLFCGYFTDELGGPTLSPKLLRELGDLGIELFLDTYLFGSEERTCDVATSS
jgi:hypothetical protein